jgi:GNAT superfamily N-acetyltransferase
VIQVAQLEEALPPPGFATLRAEALAERYRHIERLAETWAASLSTLDSAFFTALRSDELVGIGGVTRDPYDSFRDLLRLRRFYVLPTFRRAGAGRMLAEAAFTWARPRASRLSVRVSDREAAAFWEALGFETDAGPNRALLKRLGAGRFKV